MKGFQGYISSRPFQGQRTPQHVQNLVIRDYCQRREMNYLLSATEYAMPHCFMMLKSLLNEMEELNGIVAYSLFQLPQKKQERLKIYEEVLNAQRSLHFAVETLSLSHKQDITRLEDIWGVSLSVSQTSSLSMI